MRPKCASIADNSGWLPLHYACAQQNLNMEVIFKLTQAYPKALHIRAKNDKQKPYDKFLLRKTKDRDVEMMLLDLVEMYRYS